MTPTRRSTRRRRSRHQASARHRHANRSTPPPDAPTQLSHRPTIPTTTSHDVRGTSHVHGRYRSSFGRGTSHGQNHTDITYQNSAPHRSRRRHDSRPPSSTRLRRQRLDFSASARRWSASTQGRRRPRDGEWRSSLPSSVQETRRRRRRHRRPPTGEHLHPSYDRSTRPPTTRRRRRSAPCRCAPFSDDPTH